MLRAHSPPPINRDAMIAELAVGNFFLETSSAIKE
jgi:hypothetical protein